jgi:hypothetical protein
LGAVAGYQSFTAVGNANTTYYVIASQSAGEWEVGIGTYTASGTTLSRDTVLSSSNAGSLVNFSAGTKDIWVDYAAGKAVTTDTLAYPPAIGGTTPNAATFTTLTATGQTSLGGAAGSDVFRVLRDNTFAGSTTASFTAPQFSFIPPQTGFGAAVIGLGLNPRINSYGTDGQYFATNQSAGFAGTVQAKIAHTASAVNYVQVTGAATGGQPTILAQGSDATVGLTLNSKGVAPTRIQANGISIARFTGVASAVNFLDLAHSVTGQGPVIFAQSISDANVPLVLRTTGTGAIDLAAGSSGVNISNGGTVTAITGTAGGSYTTIPTVAISAPTTAGGVQATATVAMASLTVTLAGGGTGYTVNDVLTFVGGTASVPINVTVTAVSAGVITTFTVNNGGTYTALPTNPISVTGGTGTGATFNVPTWQVRLTAYTITNAGSGYVEQPTITFSSGSAAAFATIGAATSLKSLHDITVNLPSGPVLSMTDSSLPGTGAYLNLSNGSTSSVISRAVGTNTNLNFYWLTKGTGIHSFNTNNSTTTQQMVVSHTASAVNYVQVTGAATGGRSIISTQGSDASPALDIVLKGTPTGPGFRIQNQSASGTCFAVTTSAGSIANHPRAEPSIAGNAVGFSAQGSDTNISQVFQSKGTGAIDLAAGSSGVNISNGGTVTAITRTAVGSGYTTPPTPAISAPTTAGGVQATASCTLQLASISSIASGGTGYTVGNTLTVSGGTSTTAVQLTVTTVSAGVITAVSVANFGNYTAAPTNPASVTGGTGSGATFNLSFGINATFTITNAGSGYVEQPTVTFSGGGGSGAAAYAVVGSIPRLTSIGSGLEFASANGIGFRVANSGVTNVNYYSAQGNSSGGAVLFTATGTDTNINAALSSKGDGSVRIQTNNSAQEQLRVAHTASAVNYVQVTGAVTGGPPAISAQGSDATIALLYGAKGGQDHRFFSNAGNAEQFRVIHTAGTMVNQTTATGSATGVAPAFSVRGSDPNIDLALTPKGTGNVRFGTYTGTVLTPTGYVEIKDAGGTIRRLLVG